MRTEQIMTKAEAIEAMKRGEKVTHRFFEPNEWITIHENMIFAENGVRFSQGFWPDRTGKAWETDWSIFTPSPKSDKP